MIKIIIGILIIGLIWSLLEGALGLLQGVLGLIGVVIGTVTESFLKLYGKKMGVITVVLALIAFFAFSWKGMFVVIVVSLGLVLLVSGITRIGSHVTKTIEEHDAAEKEIALINENTRLKKEMQANEIALLNELDRNCRSLGFMNERMWREKLPNYAKKKYSRPFGEITEHFAKQMEMQSITQNDEWFKPFIEYLLSNPQGTTITKMLNEVDCPQFKITHNTPNYKLLYNRVIELTKRKSMDVPEVLQRIEDVEVKTKEPYVRLTKYGNTLYGQNSGTTQKSVTTESYDFNDL